MSQTTETEYDLTPLTKAQIAELATKLTDEERAVILYHGTEQPFCGALLHNKETGIYACKLCSLPLFRTGGKFDSGTGWPSFTEPVDEKHVKQIVDQAHGMTRTEIRCARCDAHLGHIFPDGPPPTGNRYCMNSVSLDFVPEGLPLPDLVK